MQHKHICKKILSFFYCGFDFKIALFGCVQHFTPGVHSFLSLLGHLLISCKFQVVWLCTLSHVPIWNVSLLALEKSTCGFCLFWGKFSHYLIPFHVPQVLFNICCFVTSRHYWLFAWLYLRLMTICCWHTLHLSQSKCHPPHPPTPDIRICFVYLIWML